MNGEANSSDTAALVRLGDHFDHFVIAIAHAPSSNARPGLATAGWRRVGLCRFDIEPSGTRDCSAGDRHVTSAGVERHSMSITSGAGTRDLNVNRAA